MFPVEGDDPAQAAVEVGEDEVRRLYARDWNVEVMERRDILASQPGFIAEGVTALHTAAYRLRRR